MSKRQVKEQFGANATAYATSKVHAKGASLLRLVELIQPQPDWQMLDIATAAGHTAVIFSSHVAHVTATDITPEMLTVAQKMADEKSITNISIELADAEALPYDDNSFDLLTCRIAAHHFPHIDQFMAHSARVLKPNGILAIVDNVVPGTHLRGKKAELVRDAGKYVNAFEKLRDPSHSRCLSLNEWQNAFKTAGFINVRQEIAQKQMEFDGWADRMQVSLADKTRLRVMLTQAPQQVAEFLTPQITGDRIHFHLTEAIIIGVCK